MNQVEEVLVKTQDIPSIPFDGMLHYEGIKIGFDVYGKKVQQDTMLYSKVYSPMPHENDEFESIGNIGNVKVNFSEEKIESIEENINIKNPVKDIKKVPARKEYNSGDYVAYEYNGETYAIEPYYQFVYKAKPKGSQSKYYCIEKNKYEDIPESVPQSKIKGSFEHGPKDSIIMKSSTMVGKLFNLNQLEIRLEFVDMTSYYDRYELINNEHGIEPKEDKKTEYSPATVTVDNNNFIIESKFDNKEVTFNIPLEPTGTPPNWVNDRLNIAMLLSTVDSDKVLMANIKKTDESSNWSSDSKEYELQSLD